MENKPSQTFSPLLLVAGVGLLVILAFFGGIEYLKHNGSSNNNSSNTTVGQSAGPTGPYAQPQMGGGGSGGGGGFQGEIDVGGQMVQINSPPTLGSVTAVTSSSITVQPSSGGSVQTFSITSGTEFSEHGTTKSYSDIQTGDTVAVIASSSNASQAQYVLINPSFQGP